MKVALFRSERRFDLFSRKLRDHDCHVVEFSFDSIDWHLHDYSSYDCLIYFPSFLGSSSRPDSLLAVKNNLRFLAGQYPCLPMFPDPRLFNFYSDKYEQYLFLSKNGFPTAQTLPITSVKSLDVIDEQIGYPCVLKNRYGAGGDYVFIVRSRAELAGFVAFANLQFSNWRSLRLLLSTVFSRKFLRAFFGGREAAYPFLSLPLMVQEFVEHDKDLKLVIGDDVVVEGHWRRKASSNMWKMNIDGGGIGEWSEISEDIQSLGVSLSRALRAKWLNVDLIFRGDEALISEFSPVWHHYAFKENDRFIYLDNYNLSRSPEEAADLEELIVTSYLPKGPNS